jgi:ADP-ribose pyrophosphatase YjhB (NUDIX family)
MLGAAAVVFDADRRLLLTRRLDNGQWCLPGGRHDAGESIAETCLRELREETGLSGEIVQLLGIYSDPDAVVIYGDGVRRQVVAAVFSVVPYNDSSLLIGVETIDARYFNESDVKALDMVELHKARVADAFSGGCGFVR